jgi:hypothetical protein
MKNLALHRSINWSDAEFLYNVQSVNQLITTRMAENNVLDKIIYMLALT